jgi:hypothetical protein
VKDWIVQKKQSRERFAGAIASGYSSAVVCRPLLEVKRMHVLLAIGLIVVWAFVVVFGLLGVLQELLARCLYQPPAIRDEHEEHIGVG